MEPEVPCRPQAREGQLSICFPSKHQVLIDVIVIAGSAAFPVDKGHQVPIIHVHMYNSVDWSNVSKVSCSRNNNTNLT